MNRIKPGRGRVLGKRISLILLFSCLLTGAVVFAQAGEKVQLTAVHPTAMRTTSLAVVKPLVLLMPTTSTSLVMAQLEDQHNSSKDALAQKTLIKTTKLVHPTSATVLTANNETQKPAPAEKVKPKEEAAPPETDGFTYSDDIPLPKDQQAYLFKLCKERNLNYKKTLAVMKHESGFDPNSVSDTNDYGLFQINTISHEELANLTQTPIKPLDPYININWGTKRLSNLYSYWGKRHVKGKELDEYVWSSYNRGIGGFRDHGKAIKYIAKVREALDTINTEMNL